MRKFFQAGAAVFIALSFAGCRMDKIESKGNVVTVNGSKGRWELVVNGEPFRLKGVGVARLQGLYEKADYLKLAKEMGANTVRTWGVDQGTQEYLDKAHEYGLYVAAGIWMNPVYADGKGSYVDDDAYKKKLKEQILEYVWRNKDHPAILFWNIGNEVIFWTASEAERVAFCQFLEEVIQDVHRLDPDHPVIYASSFTTAVPYIKKYIPSLDILGVNAYGGFDRVQMEVLENLDIPYVVTEFGTLGNWDKSRDLNGISLESTDDMKAHYYKVYANKIKNFYGYCLGGFAFQLGDTTQTSSSWWNMTHGKYPKAAYFVMKAFYQDQEVQYQPPVIKDIAFSKRKDLFPEENFDVTVQVRPYDGSLRYEYFATTARDIDFLEEYPNRKIPIRVEGSGERVRIYAPAEPGLYRIYAAVIDDAVGAASVFNKSISVVVVK
jgi:hypothetical protein